MRKIHTSMLLYLFCSVMLVLPAFAAQPQAATPRNSTGNTLNFGTYASFNDSYMQCVGSNGKFYWSAIFQTFANVVYTPCRTQMLSDIDFLGQHNIKTIRLWPVLSTFAYDDKTHSWGNLDSNINNLDEVLAELAKYNMKAYITMMSTPDCSDPPEITSELGNYFNPDLINNSTTQNQFMQAFQAFITRYKDSQSIAAYDLINEISFVLANPPTQTSAGYCNLPYDTKDFTKTKALLTSMYTTAKSIDTLHNFTFSFTKPYAATSKMVNTFRNIVDYYDIHAYSQYPISFYKNFPTYDKPVIQGETGELGTFYDHHGNDCEGVGSNSYENIAPAMPPECQKKWLVNAQAFVQQAQQHHVQAIFFHQWTPSKAYGIRLYDNNNNFLGYQMTTAGQYILGLSS
ncbi:MAG: hypothetical protein NVSMB27_35970 [Ktedonobacteraceae bacterium]